MSGNLLHLLENIGPLSPSLRQRLTGMLKMQTFKKKDYLLREGQLAKYIYFIETGLIRIFYLKDGVELCSGLLNEGMIAISVRSFFNRKPSYEYIQALEDTQTCYISYDEMESLYQEFPEFNVIGRKLITEYYVNSEDRNYWLRKQSAQEKFAFFSENLGHLLSRVPRKDIASYLGITLETLSRMGH
jgi:CRP-like cAMP-binding protein